MTTTHKASIEIKIFGFIRNQKHMDPRDFKRAIEFEVESGKKIVMELKENEKVLDSRIKHLVVEKSTALQHVTERYQEV